MLEFLIGLQKIDRRWVYLFVFVACTIPFVKPLRLPVFVSPETRGVYDCVAKCPKDKIVLIDSSWDGGSLAENKGQVEVVFEHLLRTNTKFAVMAMNCPLATQFSEPIIEKLAKKYNRKYGTDWVNLGVLMNVQDWQVMQQLARDVHTVKPEDYKGTPVGQIPLMQRVRNIDDIHMIYAVTYSPSENWLSFVHGQYGTNIGFGCAGIESTTKYRYVSSKQLCGMLVGIRGAAEYDALLYPGNTMEEMKKRTSLGSDLVVPLSFGHMVIIIAIIVGNIGYFASRRRRI